MTQHAPIHRYLNVQSAFFPSFSADGRHLAFLSNITGMTQVWRVARGDGWQQPAWPEQLTFAEERIMSARLSPTDPGKMLYARDLGGNENAQLFLWQGGGAADRPLSADYEAAMHLDARWSADGQNLLFSANRRNPALFDLYLQPLGQEARLVWQNDQPGYVFNLTPLPDGRRIIFTVLRAPFEYELLMVDIESGETHSFYSQTAAARFTSLNYLAKDNQLLLTTDLGSDFLYIGRLDLDSGQIEPLITPDWDCENIGLSHDGRLLAYCVNEHGHFELYLHNLANGETRQAPPAMGGAPGTIGMLDGQLTFSPDDNYLAFSCTGATQTSDVFVWELDSDDLHQVTFSSHGGLDRGTFVVPELIHYPTFDEVDGQKRQIPAWFYRPEVEEGRKRPVIVVVHGGPEAQFRPYFYFLIQYFTQFGYAVLAPNVRGSTGYGKAYSHLDDVEKRMDSVADLAHAAYWLKEQPDVDGDRLAVYGGSYGGFMVLSALTGYPDLWAAGVDIVGISNFVSFLENTSDYRRSLREAEYGSLERDREFLQEISPLTHIGQIQAPLMVIHGANDPRVPLSEAEQLVAKLQKRRIPVEFMVFDDEGHGLAKLKNKLVAYPAVASFLEQYLGNGE